MSKKEVERLLIAGGKNKVVKAKYNAIASKDDFVAAAKEDGYDFTVEELDQVLKESGDDFTTYGNPPARSIWWV
jgi:predicted ribosomally synthesized peptide with nif11-like leader